MPAVATLPEPSTLRSSESSSACSERRAAANRLNSQKSTGPRSPEGKARSALNALKHGVTARTPFIPSDDPDEFADLTEELLEDLNPQTALERELADRIVGICWRRRRLWRAEEQIIARRFGGDANADARADAGREQGTGTPAGDAESRQSPAAATDPDGRDFLAEQFERAEGTPLLRLSNHERRLNGAMDSALRLLLKIQDRRERRENAIDTADFEVPPVQNKAVTTPSDLLLAAAAGLAATGSNGKRTAESPAARNEPMKAASTPVRASAQNEAVAAAPMPGSASVQNKPIASAPTPGIATLQNGPIVAEGLVQRDGTGFKWGDVAAAAARALVSQGRAGELAHCG